MDVRSIVRRSVFAGALAAAGLPIVAAHAQTAVRTYHGVAETHNWFPFRWSKTPTWVTSGTATAADPGLLTEWNFVGADLQSDVMFMMSTTDENMNPISTVTQVDLISFSTSFSRSEPGAPQSLQFVLHDQTAIGANGFLFELAEPIFVQMQLTGFTPTGTPNVFEAHYEGVVGFQHWLVRDPAISPDIHDFIDTSVQTISIGVLTIIPSPSSVGLPLLAVGLAGLRRRR